MPVITFIIDTDDDATTMMPTMIMPLMDIMMPVITFIIDTDDDVTTMKSDCIELYEDCKCCSMEFYIEVLK